MAFVRYKWIEFYHFFFHFFLRLSIPPSAQLVLRRRTFLLYSSSLFIGEFNLRSRFPLTFPSSISVCLSSSSYRSSSPTFRTIRFVGSSEKGFTRCRPEFDQRPFASSRSLRWRRNRRSLLDDEPFTFIQRLPSINRLTSFTSSTNGCRSRQDSYSELPSFITSFDSIPSHRSPPTFFRDWNRLASRSFLGLPGSRFKVARYGRERWEISSE